MALVFSPECHPDGPPLLLTSFQPWLPHQRSNASDDLLLAFQERATQRALAGDRAGGRGPCILLRNLPVDFEAAPAMVRRAIGRYQPAAVVACGLAEPRSHLTLERQGRRLDQFLLTPFPVAALCQGLVITKPSDDAGSFVCNALYAELLADYHHTLAPPPLFVHVPPLTAANCRALVTDFDEILGRISQFLRNQPFQAH